MLDSGFRISDLNNIPVNGKDSKFKNRIALDNTYLLSYAHTIYGINYNKQNYKIPLTSIREDIKGFIGVESLVAPWSEQLKLWHGNWENDASSNKSYIKVWDESESLHEHYNPDKFADKENSYYIISDCPFPYESGELNNRDKGEKAASELFDGDAYTNNSINIPIKAADPHPDTKKLVTKSYIDERLSAKRLVEVTTDFYVRDYDCTYIIRAGEIKNKAFDNCFKVRYPESFNKKVLHNKIEFSVLVEGEWNAEKNMWVPATKADTNWKFFNSEGQEIQVVWLNNGENTPVQISKDYLYDNAQYIVFRFETATDNISATPIRKNVEGHNIITDYETEANYKVFVTCENLLYRSKGIETINGLECIAANIKSSDNSIKVVATQNGSAADIDLTTVDTITSVKSTDKSVTVVKTQNGSNIDYDLSIDTTDKTDVKGDDFISVEKKQNTFHLSFEASTLSTRSYIEKLPADGRIDLSVAANKTYWTDVATPKISIRNPYSIGTELVTFHLLFKTSVDTFIDTDQHFIWANSFGSNPPTFKANRLYHITFNNIYALTDDNSPFYSAAGFAKINWFVDSESVEKTVGWADGVN